MIGESILFTVIQQVAYKVLDNEWWRSALSFVGLPTMFHCDASMVQQHDPAPRCKGVCHPISRFWVHLVDVLLPRTNGCLGI